MSVKRTVALLLVGIMLLSTLGFMVTTAYASPISHTPLDAIKQQQGGNTTPGASSGGGSLTPKPNTSSILGARYALGEVRNTSGKVMFNKDNPDRKGDASIRRGYTASFLATVTDANATEEQIQAAAAAGAVKVDICNFNGGTATIKPESIKATGQGVRYDLLVSTGKYSGKGNSLALVVDHGGYYAEITMAIAECVEYQEPSSGGSGSDSTPMAVPTPYVIVSKYGYGGGKTITAGDTFTLSLTLYNTSAEVDVENMMVTIGMPEDLMLTSSSNTIYIDKLPVQESITKSFQVTARPAAKAQSHNINVSMKYQYEDYQTVTRRDNMTEETIAIPLVQVDRFQVTGVETQAEINVGEEGVITVNFVNKGRSDVYNISAEISGNIQNPGQQQNLGNLSSGATGTVDFYPIPKEGGPVDGKVTITYEDTNMEEKTITLDYHSTAISFDSMMPGNMGNGDGSGVVDAVTNDPSLVTTEKGSPMPLVLGGVVVVGIVAAVMIKKRINRKRSEAADADL